MARSPWRVGTVEQRKTGNKKAPVGCLSASDRRWPALAHGVDHSFRQAHPACADAQGVGQYQQRCVGHGGVGRSNGNWAASLNLRAGLVNAASAAPLERSEAVHATLARVCIAGRDAGALPRPHPVQWAGHSGRTASVSSPRVASVRLVARRHRRNARITTRCWCSGPTRQRRSGPSRVRCPSPRRTGRRPRTTIPCRSRGNGCR